nr:DNA-binding protein [bacterium]
MTQKSPTVDTPCSAYRDMLSDLQLVNALMGGTKAMRGAGELHLPREPKESIAAYNNRLSRSVLYNAFSDTVQKLVGKPFSKPTTIRETTPDKIKDWTRDIDRNGSDITTFAKEVFESGIRDGVTHVLVDYPPAPEGRSLADEQNTDTRPYCIHIKASDLISWNSEIINGVHELSQIRIRESVTEPDGKWGERHINRIRVIYPDKYELYEQKKNKWVLTNQGETSLGKIPLVTFYTRKTGFMTGKPPLLDLAYLNVQHWQSSSDQEHILHFIRFPLLHAAGFSPDNHDIEVGPNRMITSDNPNSKLTYVEHSGAAVEAGRQSIQDIEDRMNVTGMQLLIRKPGNPTATAASIDSSASESPLQTFSRLLENAFSEVFKLMAKWEKLEIGDTGGIDVNQDFGISMRDNRDIDALLKSRLAGEISRETFLSEMKRRGVLQENLDIRNELELA